MDGGVVGPMSRVLGERHLDNTVERLCVATMSGSTTRGATRPVTKLLWASLQTLMKCVLKTLFTPSTTNFNVFNVYFIFIGGEMYCNVINF